MRGSKKFQGGPCALELSLRIAPPAAPAPAPPQAISCLSEANPWLVLVTALPWSGAPQLSLAWKSAVATVFASCVPPLAFLAAAGRLSTCKSPCLMRPIGVWGWGGAGARWPRLVASPACHSFELFVATDYIPFAVLVAVGASTATAVLLQERPWCGEWRYAAGGERTPCAPRC